MKVVVTGAGGQLGVEMRRLLGAEAVPLDRRALDITDREQVRRTITALRPTAIINCAAYTHVDRAEEEPDICRSVNADAVAWLADACREVGATLVQISTDYIYGGDAFRAAPFRETDPPAPQGVYARAKLEGERRAAEWTKQVIVRTCGLYGTSPNSSNFVKTILRQARQGRALRVVNDQYCTPSSAARVAAAVIFLLRQGELGTWHVVNQGATTWFEFACEILRQAGLPENVEPISTEEYGARAPRPRYSVLDTSKYQALSGSTMSHWKAALAEYLANCPMVDR